MRLMIVGPNLPQQAKAEFHVHAEGCADLKRGWLAPYACGERAVDLPSAHAVVSYVYSDIMAENDENDPDIYLDEFYFAPCVPMSFPIA